MRRWGWPGAPSTSSSAPIDGRHGRAWSCARRWQSQPCEGLRYLVDAIEVMLAVREGRLADAERLAAAAYELGLDVGDADALGWYGAQLISIRWLQGRAEELLPLVQEIADSVTVAEPAAGFVAGVAALAAAAGDRPTAAAALACLRAAGLHRVASSSSWSATMLGVCEAAHLLGDRDAAAEAYALLAPFAHLPVMASLGVASFGSAHRPLGLAARTMGDLDLAVAHLERAVVAELAVDDRPWHAMALADARRRARRAGPGRRSATGGRVARRGHRHGDAARHGPAGRGVAPARRQPGDVPPPRVRAGASSSTDAASPCRTASASSTSPSCWPTRTSSSTPSPSPAGTR